ncbi:hypothetical protein NQ314_017319 [Rhamnusium bicolor]|uniref:Uncharacterized protein n=1 Tax=Rhamnusium bicolor TaxID=1586634 RepID=A0AAV8WTP7_9CUCU|nr:hypothetical protein NQ314_017319 [Rhamnusium bicolor]
MSSKRHRQFMEFQDFTNSEHHKILRHCDIRWLSPHASCLCKPNSRAVGTSKIIFSRTAFGR